MKAKEYELILMCVENGIELGWYRAHKHADAPTPEQIRTAIEHAVVTEICEWFDFEDSSDE